MNVIGIDIGTTTLSAVALAPDGRVLEAATRPTAPACPGARPGSACRTRTGSWTG
jgi:predicted NBD/HSP70 family sugar kinase